MLLIAQLKETRGKRQKAHLKYNQVVVDGVHNKISKQ